VQRNCPKHIEFHAKIKFVKSVHLFGFIIKKFVTMHGQMKIKFAEIIHRCNSSSHTDNSKIILMSERLIYSRTATYFRSVLLATNIFFSTLFPDTLSLCSSLRTHTQWRICGNKMPTRCNRGFYCRSYCLLNMIRAPLCPSSGAQEYYTVVAACGISCCGFQVAGLVRS